MAMSTTLIIAIAIAVLVVLVIGYLLMRGGADGVYTPTEMTDSVVADLPDQPSPPAAAAAPPPAAGPPDELTRIKGLGPKAAAALADWGVTRFDQIAAWGEVDIAAAAARLGPAYDDRIARDRWVEQAGLLAAGDTPAFEAEFGKLG